MLAVSTALLQACASTTYRSAYAANDGMARCGPAPQIPRALFDDPAFAFASMRAQFVMLPTSEVSEVKVVRSSGYPELDASVVRTVSSWRCPVEGISKPQVVQLPFVFRMNDKEIPRRTIDTLWVGTYKVDSVRRVEDTSSVTGRRSIWQPGFTTLERTHRIVALQGTYFGTSFRFAGPIPDEVIRFRVTWRFPEPGLANPNSRRTWKITESERQCVVASPCVAGYSFDESWELVPGVAPGDLARQPNADQ